MDTVDWVGEIDIEHCLNILTKPLHHSQGIGSVLQQLHKARAQEDDRCLGSQLKEEEDIGDGTYTMAGSDEPTEEDASMNTQMPFGTQLQHPIRSRRNDDEISIVGINRMEPVLAGNTQREELKPRSGNAMSEQQKQAQLLSLIYKTRGPVAPRAQAHSHAGSTPEPEISREYAATASPRPKETPGKRANRERIAELHTMATQTPPDKGKKRMREVEIGSPSAHYSAKKTSFTESEPDQSHTSEMSRFAAECSWMNGLRFNRAASHVPDDQAYILQKPESWYKPQVGNRFPAANIPVQTFMTLSRLADERAALEGATSSGSTNGPDPSTASYPPSSAPQPEVEPDTESDNEAPTSEVSWQTSPSPPPQRPTLPHQDLPPDSSIELPQDVEGPTVVQKSASRKDQSPHPTLPASSNENEGYLPPSSPPAAQVAEDSGDDMELETSVPQALGEDLDLPTSPHPIHTQVPRVSIRSTSVVQVKETPYVKGKNGQQPTVTISPPTQESNKHLNNSSSASIVRGTYQEMSSSAVEETRLDALHRIENKEQQDDAVVAVSADSDGVQGLLLDNDAQDVPMPDTFVHDEPLPDLARQADQQAKIHDMVKGTVQANVLAQLEPTPMSAQLPPKDSSSGEQLVQAPAQSAFAMPVQSASAPSRQSSETPSLNKRKLETTPTRQERRPSSRKRLKRVPFTKEGKKALQLERAGSLQKLEPGSRKSSTSIDSRQGSISNLSVQQDTDTKMEDLNVTETMKPQAKESIIAAEVDMSPRHQSLYAAPSPVLRPSAAPCAASSIVESARIDAPEPYAPREVPRQSAEDDAGQGQQTEVQPQRKSPPEPLAEPQPEPCSEEPKPLPAGASVSEANIPRTDVPAHAEQAPPALSENDPVPKTVFETFKTAYPEYDGNVKHFKNQCTQIEVFDREDKMVPTFMWDDFIIRNRTDFRKYAAEQVDAGEEVMPYIRFYKSTIRDALYKKGIIETRAVLLKALQELGVQPVEVDNASPQPVQQAIQQSNQKPLRSPVRQSTDRRRSHQPPVQIHPRRPIQQSPRQPAQRHAQSPMPSPAHSTITPPKKKPSRKSLPFPVPSNSSTERINGTPRVRQSLPATSSRAAPAPSPAPTASARTSLGAPRRYQGNLGEKLRRAQAAVAEAEKAQKSSALEKGSGNEVRDCVDGTLRMTSITGSTRVSSAPAPKEQKHDIGSTKHRS